MRASLTHPKRRTRGLVAGAVATAVLAMSILGGGTALAANPNWFAGYGTDRTVTPALTTGQSSTSVAAGKEVGFFTWLWNDDTSNISQLYVTAKFDGTSAGATFTIQNAAGTVVRSGSCAPAAALDCSVGPLNAGNTVYVTAAFTTKTSAADGAILPITIEYNTTGTPPGKNQSHGDAKQLPDSITISKNGDANGDFNLNDPAGLNVADDQSVSPKNPQATTVSIGAVGVGAAVGDSPSLSTPCDSTLTAGFPAFFSCSLLTSLTSTVEVGNGKTFDNPNGAGTPGIEVKVLFKKAPSQLTGSNPFAYHYFVNASGTPQAELIQATCNMSGGFPTNIGPCLIVGNNQVTVWLTHNGNMKY